MDEDLSMLFGDDDFSDDDSKGFKDEEEVWEVNEESLMASVTPPPMLVVPPPSTYEVGGPSTTAAEGPSYTLLAPGFPLVKKVIQAMGRLEQVGTQMEKGQQTATQRDEAIAGLSQQVQTLQAAVQDKDLQIQQL
ncbi:hypothetical protein Tco_0186589, partial [Tanacetum coccineum]